MKKILALLVLTVSVGAIAQIGQVELKSKKAEVTTDNAILIRTSSTPDVVDVEFNLTMFFRTCDRYDVIIKNVPCGTTRVLDGYTRGPDRCVKTNPYNNQCIRTEQTRIPRYVEVTRFCRSESRYCAADSLKPFPQTDKVKLKFKNLPALGGSETDTFQVKAKQNGDDNTNVVYEITPIKTLVPYEVVKKGILGFDSYQIRVK